MVFGDFLGVSSLDLPGKLSAWPNWECLTHGKLTLGVVLALFHTCEIQLPDEHRRKLSVAKQVLAALKAGSLGCLSLSVDLSTEFLLNLSRDRKNQDEEALGFLSQVGIIELLLHKQPA